MPTRATDDQPRSPSRTWAAFGLLALIWASSFLFIEIALGEGVGPVTLAALRTALGVAFLGFAVAIRGGGRPVDGGAWIRLVILAVTNVALPFVLIMWGQLAISSGMAAILNALVPLFAVILATVVVHDETLTPNRVAGLLVGFLGVALLALPSLDAATQDPNGGARVIGMLAVAGASFIYAIGVVYARRQLGDVPIIRAADGGRRRASVLEITFWQVLVATAILVVAAIVIERPAGGLVAFPTTMEAWLAIVWLGVLGTGVAYLLFFRVVGTWGATRTSLVTYVIPPIAIVLGVVILDERFAILELIGTALIIAGIVVVNATPARRTLATRSSSA